MIRRLLTITLTGLILASLPLSAMAAGYGPGGSTTHRAARASSAQWTWERIPLFAVARSGVTGSAYFTYNTRSGITTVTLTVRGLRPMSVHPAHIHRGRCGSNGPVLYPFPAVLANRVGVSVTTTRFRGRFAHRPWYINVHRGPGMTTMAQASVISCGNVL